MHCCLMCVSDAEIGNSHRLRTFEKAAAMSPVFLIKAKLVFECDIDG